MTAEGIRLKGVAQIIAGQSPASEDVSDLVDGLPFIQGNAEFGPETPTPQLQCDVAPKKAQPGDLLLSVRAPVGAINIATEPLGIGRGVCAVRPRDVHGRFLWWWLHDQVGLLDAVSTGSTFRAVNAGQIGNLRLAIVDADRQRAIADFLDRETAQIDAMVDAQERLVALLEERRSAVVTAAVTEGIRRAPLAETGNRWLPLIPEAWDLVQFRRVVKVVNGLVDPTEPQYANMLLIAPNHVEKGTGRVLALETAAEQHAESGKYVVRAGQIIYSKIRPALNKVTLATLDCLCSADMYALDSDHGRMTNRFLAYYLRARPFHAFASEMSMRVAMPKVNREEIASGPIAVPPLAEQGEIVEHLDYAMGRIDRAISRARESIALMKERRAAVISAAVTGRIDVRTGIEQVERDLEEARA